MSAASEMSAAALAINTLVTPTGARITTNVLVPPTCARTRQNVLVPPIDARTRQEVHKQAKNTTSKTVRYAQTNEYLISAVDLPLEGGRLDYAWLRGALVGS